MENMNQDLLATTGSIELGHSNLYVTRLPLDIHETQLHEAFSQCGTVISLKIFRSFQVSALSRHASRG